MRRDKKINVLKFRCPPWLTEAIVKAARSSHVSVSDFLRETAIARIKQQEFVATRNVLRDADKSPIDHNQLG